MLTSAQTNGQLYRRGLYLGGAMADRTGRRARFDALDDALRDDVTKLVTAASAMFYVKPENSGTTLTYHDGLTRPTLGVLAEELRTDALHHGDRRAPSEFELIAAVIAKGDEYNLYGSGKWRSSFDALHLLTCGINWASVPGVEHDTWSEFAGTDEVNDVFPRLSVEAFCRCPGRQHTYRMRANQRPVHMKFGIVPPSFTQVIVHLHADRLDEILEV
jgi:hypothetical protein